MLYSSIQAGHCIHLKMIESISTAGIIMKQLGLFIHAIFMVISAGVLGTRPYLGPFLVLELNNSLCKPFLPHVS